jgi:predicted aspartyl protease
MANQKEFFAFTTRYNHRANKILTEIIITDFAIQTPPADGSNQITVNALWDTGATNSVITESTAKSLNLKPISSGEMATANGMATCSGYLVNLFLPHRVAVIGTKVLSCKDTNNSFGAIIGMDIITSGDFSISNLDKKTVVSFIYPSIKTIDYVHEANLAQSAGIGRNDPCYCGRKGVDGRAVKFKNCHGKQT